MVAFAEMLALAGLDQLRPTYEALRADSQARQERLHSRGTRADQLNRDWLNIRAEATTAADFFKVSGSVAKPARKKMKSDGHFFAREFLRAPALFREVGRDISRGDADLHELSSDLGDDVQHWADILRPQLGMWESETDIQIRQAITALELIGRAKNVRKGHWRPLDLIGEPKFILRGPDNVEMSVQLGNPNSEDSPVSPLLLVIGGVVYILWPKKDRVPAGTIVSTKLRVNASIAAGTVRFAYMRETVRSH